MDDPGAARSRRHASGQQCPICGRFFSHEQIFLHADQCARRMDPKSSEKQHVAKKVASAPSGTRKTLPKPVRKPSSGIGLASGGVQHHKLKPSTKKLLDLKRKHGDDASESHGRMEQGYGSDSTSGDDGTDEDFIEGFRIASQSLKPWMKKVKAGTPKVAPSATQNAVRMRAAHKNGQSKKICPDCCAKLPPRANKCPCGHTFSFYNGSSMSSSNIATISSDDEYVQPAKRSKDSALYGATSTGYHNPSSSEEDSEVDVSVHESSEAKPVAALHNNRLHASLPMADKFEGEDELAGPPVLSSYSKQARGATSNPEQMPQETSFPLCNQQPTHMQISRHHDVAATSKDTVTAPQQALVVPDKLQSHTRATHEEDPKQKKMPVSVAKQTPSLPPNALQHWAAQQQSSPGGQTQQKQQQLPLQPPQKSAQLLQQPVLQQQLPQQYQLQKQLQQQQQQIPAPSQHQQSLQQSQSTKQQHVQPQLPSQLQSLHQAQTQPSQQQQQPPQQSQLKQQSQLPPPYLQEKQPHTQAQLHIQQPQQLKQPHLQPPVQQQQHQHASQLQQAWMRHCQHQQSTSQASLGLHLPPSAQQTLPVPLSWPPSSLPQQQQQQQQQLEIMQKQFLSQRKPQPSHTQAMQHVQHFVTNTGLKPQVLEDDAPEQANAKKQVSTTKTRGTDSSTHANMAATGNSTISIDDPKVKQCERGMSVADAAEFLDKVKNAFVKQSTMHANFLDIMTGFKASTIGTQEVMEQVFELFKDQPQLIHDFNKFLPVGYVIHVLPPHVADYRNAKHNFQQAHQLSNIFLQTAKRRIGSEAQYVKLLQSLQHVPHNSTALQNGNQPWNNTEHLQFKYVQEQVQQLMVHDDALFEEFCEFMPRNGCQSHGNGYTYEVPHPKVA